MKNQPKKSKIEKSEIEIFLKIFDEKSIFRFFRKFRFFEIFIENPMEILIFREIFGVKNLQLQNDLQPKLR